MRNLGFWWFYKNFYNHFIFYTSKNEEELSELFKLRYKVYCLEYNYIDKSKLKGEVEQDEWDKYSEHFIIRDTKKNISATVRLIRNSEISFPILKHFKIDVDLNSINLDRATEISRLIVTREYRRHHLLFVLIKGIYLFVKEKEIENVFSVMDDKLFPMLNKMGIPFRKIGQPSMFQGLTYPCILNVREFEAELSYYNPRLFQYLVKGDISFNEQNHKYTVS